MRCWVGGDESDFLPPDPDDDAAAQQAADQQKLAKALSQYANAYNREQAAKA